MPTTGAVRGKRNRFDRETKIGTPSEKGEHAHMPKMPKLTKAQRGQSKRWLALALERYREMSEDERAVTAAEALEVGEDGNTIVGERKTPRERGKAVTLADICAGTKKPPKQYWMTLDEFADLSGLGYFKSCQMSKEGLLPGRMEWKGRVVYRRDALTLLIQRIKDAGSWEKAILDPILDRPEDLVHGAIIKAREAFLVNGQFVDPKQAKIVEKKVKRPPGRPRTVLTPEEVEKQTEQLETRAFLTELAALSGFEGETTYEVMERKEKGKA